MRAGKLKVSAGADMVDLTHDKQRELIELTTKGAGEVKPGKMRALVRQEKKRDVVHKINRDLVGPMPDGSFGLIVVDYPWPYKNSDQHEGSRGHMPYPPMPMDEIYAHAVEASKRAADDCILGLYVTNAFVHEIGRVLAAWDFPKTARCSPGRRTGSAWASWARGGDEAPWSSRRAERSTHTLNEIRTLIKAPVREHSEKPTEIFRAARRKHCAGPAPSSCSRSATGRAGSRGAPRPRARRLPIASRGRRSWTATDDQAQAEPCDRGRVRDRRDEAGR